MEIQEVTVAAQWRVVGSQTFFLCPNGHPGIEEKSMMGTHSDLGAKMGVILGHYGPAGPALEIGGTSEKSRCRAMARFGIQLPIT